MKKGRKSEYPSPSNGLDIGKLRQIMSDINQKIAHITTFQTFHEYLDGQQSKGCVVLKLAAGDDDYSPVMGLPEQLNEVTSDICKASVEELSREIVELMIGLSTLIPPVRDEAA